MGTKTVKAFRLGWVALSLGIHAGATPPTATWREGGKERTAYVVENAVAHFGASAKERETFRKRVSGKKLWESASGALYRVSPQRMRNRVSDAQPEPQSPVFSDAPSGGTLMALPGGVVLTVGSELAERDGLEKWVRERQLEIAKPLPSQVGQRSCLVKTAPGMSSIALAQKLSGEAGVIEAVPNWWVHVEAKPSKTPSPQSTSPPPLLERRPRMTTCPLRPLPNKDSIRKSIFLGVGFSMISRIIFLAFSSQLAFASVPPAKTSQPLGLLNEQALVHLGEGKDDFGQWNCSALAVNEKRERIVRNTGYQSEVQSMANQVCTEESGRPCLPQGCTQVSNP